MVQEQNEKPEDKEKEQEQPKTVPIEALKAQEEKTKQAETNAQLMADQLRLHQANAPQAEAPKDILDGIFTGEDDKVVDKDQLKEVVNRLVQIFGTALGGVQAMAQRSDYSEIVTKYLPEVINNDPALAQELANLQKTNPAAATAFGYRLAKTNPKFAKDQEKPQEKETPEQKAAAAAIEAANKPGSASQASSGGALGLASQIANESEDDFETRVANVKAKG